MIKFMAIIPCCPWAQEEAVQEKSNPAISGYGTPSLCRSTGLCISSVTKETMFLPTTAVVTEERRPSSCVQMLSMRPWQDQHPVRQPQTYGLKRRTPLELLAFSSGTEAHCPGPALHAA
ncbi:hypothetical protein KUCAC02_013106 [Xyrichtys novacula]|uniref:Uncharacterized protein n=1 Tax=Xyrichtys novacula TaxID=13765 RepID=A0AAV1HL20_XYRNO|nr:hypothetical protein KUCAC02_013106 [Xyrichtys novacula]